MENTSLSLSEQACATIWPPFTQMQTAQPPIPIVKGKGSYLYSACGRKILDGISSWWVNLHGHAHPYIIEKIKLQAECLEHVIFAGFTHPPAIELATRLLEHLPGPMSKIFYSDNGSTSVEIAIKIAFQYFYNKNPSTERIKIVCFKQSYHGDTFGAMSAAGKNEFTKPFWKHFFEVDTIVPPTVGQEEVSLSQLKAILSKEKTACFIFEPLILGSGGMIIYPAAGLNPLLELCEKHHVLTIADEVMTGFGRTGTLFASEQLTFSPDMICLSKGLTGGFLPMGITACKEKIFNAFLGDHLSQAFLHGHSYTANPLACSSALASLDLLQKEACFLQRESIAASHAMFCHKWQHHPRLKRCESLGTILALEYRVPTTSSYFQPISNSLYRFFLDQDILLRPLGNVLYILPPYCISQEELQRIYEQIIITLEG